MLGSFIQPSFFDLSHLLPFFLSHVFPSYIFVSSPLLTFFPHYVFVFLDFQPTLIFSLMLFFSCFPLVHSFPSYLFHSSLSYVCFSFLTSFLTVLPVLFLLSLYCLLSFLCPSFLSLFRFSFLTLSVLSIPVVKFTQHSVSTTRSSV